MTEIRKYPPSYYKYQSKFKAITLHIPKEIYSKFINEYGKNPRKYLTNLIVDMVNNGIAPQDKLTEEKIKTLENKITSLKALNEKLIENEE